MAGIILSFFDQNPEYNGVPISIRGADGYFSVKNMNEAIVRTAGGKPKRFNDWLKTKFAQEVIAEIGRLTGIPVDYDDSRSQDQTPLIDYKRGGTDGVWLHPSLVGAFALQDPKLYARVSIWLGNLISMGTVNPHVLQWTREEYLRGLQFNRDDLQDLYE